MAQLFYELNLPALNIDDDGNSIWTVRIKDAPAYYLVNDGSFMLDNLMVCAEAIFHFNSLLDAHFNACSYYSSHKQVYPYFDEYNDATLAASSARFKVYAENLPDNFIVVDVQSQQMVFK